MNLDNNSVPIIEGVHPFDAYLETKIWVQQPNHSTYVDNKLEEQCILSSKSLEELREDIEKESQIKVKSKNKKMKF